jgi:hypothetical protein
MAPIIRSKVNNDVVGRVVNNEVGIARNQSSNLEALTTLATQTVYLLEDLINRVSAIERTLKTNTKSLSLQGKRSASQNDEQGGKENNLNKKQNN